MRSRFVSAAEIFTTILHARKSCIQEKIHSIMQTQLVPVTIP